MATQRDVRTIAMALPGVTEGATHGFGFGVAHRDKVKGFVWSWKERVDPKKARVARDDVIAVRVADADAKAALLAADPDVIFTEPHYNGFPAVLVRLPAIRVPELRKLIVDAWRCMAPRAAVAAYDAGAAAPKRPRARKPAR